MQDPQETGTRLAQDNLTQDRVVCSSLEGRRTLQQFSLNGVMAAPFIRPRVQRFFRGHTSR